MARLYCSNCGTPLARRATVCLACETPVTGDQAVLPADESKSLLLKCAIACVALSCLGFVVVLGVTSLFQDGGLVVGGVFLTAILFSVRWVNKLEKTSCIDDRE
nr:hypothetical protein [uncultured Desulfuromonas sp.]